MIWLQNSIWKMRPMCFNRYNYNRTIQSIRRGSALFAGSLSLLLGCSIFLASCDEPGNSGSDNFDRQGMLQDYATNLIYPAYDNFLSTSQNLQNQWQAFQSNPGTDQLLDLRISCLDAYEAWQECAAFDFGPAMDLLALSKINTHPSDSIEIESLIVAADWNFNQADQIDAQGFPALDYLLWHSSDSEILAELAGTDRQAFISDLINEIVRLATELETEWQTGASYYDIFINANATDVGSSSALMINALNRYFERNLRDGKIGIPLGVRSLGIPIPDKAEAYYADESLRLFNQSIEAYRALLVSGSSSLGLDDWIDAVDAQHSGGPLSAEIETRLEEIELKSQSITGSLKENIASNPDQVQELYDDLQNLLVLLKVDLPSALGILITYQDNDGD